VATPPGGLVHESLYALLRTVWLIGLPSVRNDSASDRANPLAPCHVASVRMAGLRVPGSIAGIAEATEHGWRKSGKGLTHQDRMEPLQAARPPRPGIGRSFTPPYLLQANGKAERFTRNLPREWAYARPNGKKAERVERRNPRRRIAEAFGASATESGPPAAGLGPAGGPGFW
jgi:hypothetical protein